MSIRFWDDRDVCQSLLYCPSMKQVGEEVEQYEDARICGVVCRQKLEDFAQKTKFGRNFDFRAKKLKNKDDIRSARPMFPKSKEAGIFDGSTSLAN